MVLGAGFSMYVGRGVSAGCSGWAGLGKRSPGPFLVPVFPEVRGHSWFTFLGLFILLSPVVVTVFTTAWQHTTELRVVYRGRQMKKLASLSVSTLLPLIV